MARRSLRRLPDEPARRPFHRLAAVGCCCSVSLLSLTVLAAPKPYSPREVQELQRTENDLKSFGLAARSYRDTVNGIVRRAYEYRRKLMLRKYDEKITKEEAEERTRRIAAITLFEDFLRRYPNDKRWTPDVIFRLAELYFEKSNDEYLQATANYDKLLRKFERKEIAEAPAPPKQDYSQTISLHRKLIREFPRYRLIDGAYYLLGFCLTEMGDYKRGNQAFLALVCANQYKPPLEDAAAASAADAAKAGKTAGGAAAQDDSANKMQFGPDGKPILRTDVYDGCKPLLPKSRFNAESWTRVGEYHFDENDLGQAIAAYRRVLALGPKKNPYYDEALYKLAWTYYRADRFIEAIRNFDKLVVYADKEKERTGKAGSEMRPEALQYLGVSFAEDDWNGDQVPDSETGMQRIDKFYQGRFKEKHVYEVYRRLGNIYFDTTKYKEAIAVYKEVLRRWPYRPENPEVQQKIIDALERLREFDKAMTERAKFSELFGKGTDWEKRNRNNPEALRKAREFDEQALIQAAVFHHKAGQELRKRGLVTSNVDLLKRAKDEYAVAAKAYERYLERFPNSKNSYEVRFSYASCLFFSQRFPEAATQYGMVRDSNLDNRYQDDAAFGAVQSWREQIKLLKASGQVTEPPLPKATMKLASLQPKPLPPAFKSLQKELDAHVKMLPNHAKSPTMAYKAAEISYRFLHFDDARTRFAKLYDKYCKDVMAKNAGEAILVTYQLEKNLDEMEKWATKLASGKCGGKAAGQNTGKLKALLGGIKFKRAMTLFKRAQKLYDQGKKREAAPIFDAAAKAFLRVIDSNPNSPDAPSALFNVGVAYEKSMRFESATKTYERVYQKYPQHKLAGEALWRAAENQKRFFDFRDAVKSYKILADAPRFASNEHRDDAIYNAALILENDQQYGQAAQLFLRYAKAVEGRKPKDAAESYFRAGLIYGKMNDIGQMTNVLRRFPHKYGSVKGQAPRAVEAMFRIGERAQKRGSWPTAKRYYLQTISEYNRRGLPPAGDAAEYAAHASFELAEKKLEKFLKTSIKTKFLRTIKRKQKKLELQAKKMRSEYDAILRYKRPRWTLAALYRRGTIFEHVATQVASGYRALPVPRKVKRLGQDAIDIYMEQLDEVLRRQVEPLETETKKLYKIAIDKAKELNVSNQYTEAAEQRLNALDPTSYPLLKRAKTKVIIE